MSFRPTLNYPFGYSLNILHELRSVGGRLDGAVRIACAAGAESRLRQQEEGRRWVLKAARVGKSTASAPPGAGLMDAGRLAAPNR